MAERRFKTAFILGAGLGTRLRPLTERCPKPLLELGGRPIITYAMDHLLSAGIERFIVNTHHCPEVYHQKFPNMQWRGVPIICRHEPVLLDSAGGLKNIEDLLAEDQTILCYNGDAITNLPLNSLIERHTGRQSDITMVLRSSGSPLNVDINEQGEICDIRQILNKPGIQRCFFASIYALETSMLQHIEPGRIESIIPIMIKRISLDPGSVQGIILDDGYWLSPDSVEDYDRLKTQINGLEGF